MKKVSLWASPRFLAIALGLLLGLGVGCAKKIDDAKISSEIQSKFGQDSGLSGKQLSVQANTGVVTLAGAVDNDAQRDAAARQAASVAGVKEVINNLQVGSAANAGSPSDEHRTVSRSAEDSKPGAGRKSHRSHDGNNTSTASDTPADQGNQNVANNDPAPPAAAPPDVAPSTPPPPPPPKKLIIDQGTQLTVRLIDPIDSEKNQTGDTFHATLNAPLTSDGEEAIPAGTNITGHLVDVKSAGKFAGQSQVVMQLDSITAGGQTYTLQTDQYKKQGSSRGKNTAEKVGGGAVLGGIIGALAGGGKGAAIGAAAGAGVGGGVQAATKSQQIKLPSETVLNFTLQAPVTVVKSPNPNDNRPKLGGSQ